MRTKLNESEQRQPARALVDHLRAYQRRDRRDIDRAFREHKSVLYVAFMGSGKTVVGADVVRTFARQGKRVLFLVHKGEILKQTLAKLKRAGLEARDTGVIWSDHDGLNLDAPVQLASVQTLVRREPVKDVGLVVIDEAHHVQAATWKKVLDRHPHEKLLGMTATPERLDGKPMREFFEEMVLGEPPESLIESGFLSRPEVWTRDDNEYVKLKKLKKGDYSAKRAEKSMQTIIGRIPKWYLKRAVGLAAVCFCATKAQAERLVREFADAGVRAETLFDEHSETERDARLARLKNKQTRVLCTCDILGEGWDYAECRCVILARPTASIARYMQWCGRCMRPGSTSAIVLDMAGNCRWMGPPWRDNPWTLDTPIREKSLHVVQVAADGRATFLEPIEKNGRLVRADFVEPIRCSICEEPATVDSARNIRRSGGRYKAYCEKHLGAGHRVARLPCAVCGRPATQASSNSARQSGRQTAYCEQHKQDQSPRPIMPCAICGNPATKGSSNNARLKGGTPFCKLHARGKKSLLQCEVCGSPATRDSSNRARRYVGHRAYCEEHRVRTRPLLPCTICGQPATRRSSSNARRLGLNPYCEKHRAKGVSLSPCAVCGQPATRNSSHTARRLGLNAYCETHRGGRGGPRDHLRRRAHPLLPCTTCGAPSTRRSSGNARRRGLNAYCEKHRAKKRAVIPCMICGNPSKRRSTYCKNHDGRIHKISQDRTRSSTTRRGSRRR